MRRYQLSWPLSSTRKKIRNCTTTYCAILLQILFLITLFNVLCPIEGNKRASLNIHSPQDTKIQGGIQTSNHEFPFLVSLQQRSVSGNVFHKCCGSIISKRFILTAGHCAYEASATNYAAVMGVTTLSECTITKSLFSSGYTIQSSSSCVVARVKALHLHPSYDDYSLNNDIAIVELYDDIPYSSTIKPVTLASSLPAFNAMQIVAGWGITSSYVNQAVDHMMKATVPYVEDKYCNDLELDMSTTVGKLCAGAGDGKDACAGDSGSGLFHTVNSTDFIEIGIVSYGPSQCGTPAASSNRGVYTTIPFHKEWIKAISNVSVGVSEFEYENIVVTSNSSSVHIGGSQIVLESGFYSMNLSFVVILNCLLVMLINYQ